ncbi:MAG: hypothetical protein PHE21_02990 [Candidatus Dojkabacteria bacterium]|nr:hypothetical protein [Candidatus Dojkabacteria bacterium]
MDIELEKDSAPNIEQFLKERNIEAVVFDVDNTVFATGEGFVEDVMKIGFKVAKYVNNDKSPEVIAQEYSDMTFGTYVRRGSKPTLIDALCKEGIIKYLGEEAECLVDEIIGDDLKDFYKKVPMLYKNSVLAIRSVLQSKVNVAFHSHAQEDWTKRKISFLGNELGGINLPFLATSIDEIKDRESWMRSFALVGGYVKNIMVVGDGVEFDLVPAMEAGCEYVVWLNGKDRPIPEILYEYKKKGKFIYMIKDIGDLRYLSDDYLI